MLVLASWLREIAPFEADYAEVAERLTLAGLEVEAMEPAYPWMDRAVVARISRVEPVNKEKHVTLCTVEIGSDEVGVICGAPNVREGMLTAYVPPGTEMPDGSEIREAQIYGHLSTGMLCSMREIMLEGDASGIFDISKAFPDARVGHSISSLLGMEDTVFEIGITPNRPDCLSMTGVAREVSAIFRVPLRLPESRNVFSNVGDGDVSIEIQDTELCHRYVGVTLKNVKVASSPGWMARRLVASGIRPINNVVDITNYILMETGQPLHAFDLDTLKGRAIVVRVSEEGDTIVTLDGKERKLSAGVLLICDMKRPVAVAGVMGGLDTEVTDKTSSVLLESAWFAPWSIRRTAKMLKLPSEASYRFERGVDFDGQLRAAQRASDLLSELAGGVIEGLKDENPRPYVPRSVVMKPERTNSLLGTDLDARAMANILESIDIKVKKADRETVEILVPSFRPDIKEEIDLVEEIARLHGFANIATASPVGELIVQAVASDKAFEDNIKTGLAGQGCSEIISYSFISPDEIKALGFDEDDRRNRFVRLKNPLAEDQSVMRTSLVCSMLSAISRNHKKRNMDLALFEAGAVFIDNGQGVLPDEEHRLCIAMTGRRFPQTWAWQDREVDFFDLKGVVENLLYQLNVRGSAFKASSAPEVFYVPGTCMSVVSGNGIALGTLGQISAGVQSRYKISSPVFLADFSLSALKNAVSGEKQFKPLARFPAMDLDLAIILNDSVRAEDVLHFIREKAGGLLEDVSIFDVYRGKPVPKGRKSLAFRLIYRAEDHTLSEVEVMAVHEPLVDALLEEFHAEMRS